MKYQEIHPNSAMYTDYNAVLQCKNRHFPDNDERMSIHRANRTQQWAMSSGAF